VDAKIGLVLKFFSDIVSNVLNTAFNTLGETHETVDEIGTLENISKVSDILDDFSEL
jgi:hypothetical protein